jgi:hypothetical protein
MKVWFSCFPITLQPHYLYFELWCGGATNRTVQNESAITHDWRIPDNGIAACEAFHEDAGGIGGQQSRLRASDLPHGPRQATRDGSPISGKDVKDPRRHNLHVIGYWVTEDPAENTFVFLLAHASREEAKKNWDAFRLDPEFQEVEKSEQAEKTLEKADILWLRPADFSPVT